MTGQLVFTIRLLQAMQAKPDKETAIAGQMSKWKVRLTLGAKTPEKAAWRMKKARIEPFPAPIIPSVGNGTKKHG